jgi:predicted nucleotide-binding protein (sugar kinase/HSP70/actin superfamily)
LTSDKLTESEVNSSIKNIGTPHWSLGSRVLGSSIYYSKDNKVDGIIYITPFGCSSDALIKEYMDANIHDKKPVLTLTVDEHSSDAGMITRIEAFLDMIERRKEIVKNTTDNSDYINNKKIIINNNRSNNNNNSASNTHEALQNPKTVIKMMDVNEMLNETDESNL